MKQIRLTSWAIVLTLACLTPHVAAEESWHVRCQTPHPSAEDAARIEQALKVFRADHAFFEFEVESQDSVTIPVYFHVINKGTGTANGDIPDSQIEAQIAVLNDSFSGVTGGAQSPFTSVLEATDRTTDAAWYAMGPESSFEAKAKASLRRGGPGTLNIYSAKPGLGVLGWASYPWDYADRPKDDGVVLHYETLPGGSAFPFDEGDTAVHYVGHWLGLYHTFRGRCGGSGAEVTDTPPEKSPAYGCPVGRDTCPTKRGLDPINNFMNYSDDDCMDRFTKGQVTRMSDLYQQYRGY